MTATALTYVVAQEHINDLMRDAERRRQVAEVRSPGRVRSSIPRVFTRRVRRAATA
jgi:hypothetical protein